MRIYKHGDSLAIVLPEKIRKSSEMKEGDEYELFELEKGSFVMVSKGNLEDAAKKSAIALLIRGQEKKEEFADGKIPLDGADPQKGRPSNPSSSVPANQIAQTDPSLGKGYMVIASEEEAKQISMKYEKEIKSGEIMGVRGFDKKFYIVAAPYFRLGRQNILAAIGSREMGLRDIALATNLDEDGCNSILQVAKEQGEVIEKKKGLFKVIA
ncbi:MAG: AbrB/MazE/SpoVT family DNA-binding domain-containing protein [Candidatus Micrarchaeota archaeon]